MDKDLFYEIILFVEQRGYNDCVRMLPVMPTCKSSYTSLAKDIFWEKRWEIIFNHEFAKALWGVEFAEVEWHRNIINHEVLKDVIFTIDLPNNEHYLREMVLEKDPFAYLEQEYKRIKKC